MPDCYLARFPCQVAEKLRGVKRSELPRRSELESPRDG
jgi:hypothetical protein